MKKEEIVLDILARFFYESKKRSKSDHDFLSFIPGIDHQSQYNFYHIQERFKLDSSVTKHFKTSDIKFILKLIIENWTFDRRKERGIMNFTDQGINTQDGFGISLLHLACQDDDLIPVKSLIERGINIHLIDTDNDTAMGHAIYYGNLKVIEYLIDIYGIHYYDETHNSFLHKSVYSEKNTTFIIDLLIEKGLSVNVQNLSGYTPLSLAAYNADIKTFNYLLNNKKADISIPINHPKEQKTISLTNLLDLLLEDSKGNSKRFNDLNLINNQLQKRL